MIYNTGSSQRLIMIYAKRHPLMAATRRGYAVFGLLSLLIVVAIIMFLLVGPLGGSSPKPAPGGGPPGGTGPGGAPPTTGGGYVRGAINTKRLAQATVIQSNINQICIMMAVYRTSHDGKLPATAADLETADQIFNDQWGNPMTFKYGEAPQGSVVSDVIFHSAGKDEQMGTADDVIWKGKIPY